MDKHQADFNKVEKIILGQTDFFKSIGRDADFEWIYYGWDGIEAKRQEKVKYDYGERLRSSA